MKRKETFAQELCDILVKHKVLSLEDSRAMHSAFKDSDKEQFDDFLLEEGLVQKEDLLRALAEYYQVPAFDVVGYFFDHVLLRNFPKEFLLENRIIPLALERPLLTLVASHPDDQDLLVAIGKYVTTDVQFRVGLGRDIEDAVKEYYDPSLTEVENDDYLPEQEHDTEESLTELLEEDDED